MRVLLLDTKPFNNNRYIVRGVLDALVKTLGATGCVLAEYNNVLEVARKGKFDLFLAFGGEEAHNPIVLRAAKLARSSAIWFTEDPYELRKNQRLAEHFDVVFSNDRASSASYGSKGHHLPLAGDPVRNYWPVPTGRHRFDVFFAGTAWPNRLKFLRKLRERRPDLRLKFLLVSNPALEPHLGDLAKGFDFSPGVPIREFCRLANASAVTLTLPRKFATGHHRPDAASDTPGPRIFEVALAGSCQVVDAETTPLVNALFREGEHFEGYGDEESCLDAIDALLADRPRIDRIARAAQEHAVALHTYSARVEQLLATVRPVIAARAQSAVTLQTTRRPRVLLVTHNLSSYGGFGGAEVYLDRLRSDAKDVDLWVLAQDKSVNRPTRYALFDRHLQPVESFDVPVPCTSALLIHPPIEFEFQRLVIKYQIDIVHFNHLLSFPLSLPRHAKALGCATLYSLHDYYLLCDQFTLTDAFGNYCGIDSRALSACDGCLARTKGIAPGSQSRRLRYMRDVLRSIDAVLVGSMASEALFARMYPQARGKCVLVTPPVSPRPPRIALQSAEGAARAPLRVVHLGNFTSFKGARTVLDAARALQDERVEFHIFGRVDAPYGDEIARLPTGVIHVHGPYPSGQLPAAVSQCDVMLFLSTWPETYGITLSEGQSAGLVPIVTQLGGQAERVRHERDGFVVAPGRVDAVVETIRLLARDPIRLAQMKLRQPEATGPSPAAFAEQVQTLYGRYRPDSNPMVPECERYMSFEELGLFISQPTWTQIELDPSFGFVPPTVHQMSRLQRLAFYMHRFMQIQRQQGLRIAWGMARRRLSHALERRLARAAAAPVARVDGVQQQ